jgi:hypothetical protein
MSEVIVAVFKFVLGSKIVEAQDEKHAYFEVRFARTALPAVLHVFPLLQDGRIVFDFIVNGKRVMGKDLETLIGIEEEHNLLDVHMGNVIIKTVLGSCFEDWDKGYGEVKENQFEIMLRRLGI